MRATIAYSLALLVILGAFVAYTWTFLPPRARTASTAPMYCPRVDFPGAFGAYRDFADPMGDA